MVPKIFDTHLLRLRLLRAQRCGFIDFLYSRLHEDFLERLKPITREFHKIVDLGTPLPLNTHNLSSLFPKADISRFSIISEKNAYLLFENIEKLPEDINQSDLIFSLGALQVVNDLPGLLIQIRRNLKPDGLFLACLLGGETLVELKQSFSLAESNILGGISPRIAPFPDLFSLGSLLQRAGFTLPVVDSDRITVRYDHAFALIKDLRLMGMSNPLQAQSRKPLNQKVFQKMAEIYQENYSDADGRIRATFDIIWILGWAPDESQSKPLKPGQFQVGMKEAIRKANEDKK